ncbi:MAG: hypothetical protein Q9166_001042 [cf. Caloplaca sp. 2 TL-2023]
MSRTAGRSRKRRGPGPRPPRATKASPTKPFPFMELPAEIRRQIYSLALPAQKTPLKSTDWARTSGREDDHDRHYFSMGILASNKAISNEAREVMYGHNSFTVIIQYWKTVFLGRRTIHDHQGFGLFPSATSQGYIKNWQLDLHLEYHDTNITEAVLTLSEELVHIDDLESLKVKFPCLCRISSTFPYNNESCEIYHERVRTVLDALKRLHFTRSVTFIAAHHFDKDEYSKNDHGRFEDFTRPVQCQQPDCPAFTTSLDDLKSFFTSSAPRLLLSSPQRKYLDLKEQAAFCYIHSWYFSRIKSALRNLWYAVAGITLVDGVDDRKYYHYWSEQYPLRLTDMEDWLERLMESEREDMETWDRLIRKFPSLTEKQMPVKNHRERREKRLMAYGERT